MTTREPVSISCELSSVAGLSLRAKPQLFEDDELQVLNCGAQLEIVQDDRANHAAIEKGRNELSHAIAVDTIEKAGFDAASNDAGQHLALLCVEARDRRLGGIVTFMSTFKIERYLNEAMDFGIVSHVIVEPCSDHVRRIAVLFLKRPHVFEALRDNKFDGGAQQRCLAVEVIIDESGVDPQTLSNFFDRDRGEVSLSKELQCG